MKEFRDSLPTGMVQEKAPVVSHKRIAADHYLLRLKSRMVAERARAGQFVHLLCGPSRCDGGIHPFLRRPLSLFDTDPRRGTIDFIYKVVGLGTAALAEIPSGARVDFIGPLGRPFDAVRSSTRVFLIGGGVGIPPLYFLAKELLAQGIRTEAFLGARTKKWVICASDFRKLKVPVHVATDDGTLGHKGSVVGLLKNEIASAPMGPRNDAVIYACGPTPMMAAAARLARRLGIPAEVSLEERMGCAMGCCMGCVVEVKRGQVPCDMKPDRGHKVPDPFYQRVCTEGPVFPAEAVAWR